MNEENNPENSRPSRTIQLPARPEPATAAVVVAQDQPSTSKQGGGVTRRTMTRAGDGHATAAECYPLHQLLGQGQPTAAADSSGSAQQEQQQQQQQQLQQACTDEPTTSSSMSPDHRSGWRDELALMKHENVEAQQQQQQQQQRLSSTPPPAAAAAATTTTAADPNPSPSQSPPSPYTRETPPLSGENHPSPASADNNYAKWPTSLLQRVCARRGIRGVATCRVNQTMALLLAELDLKVCRPSPYVEDLREIALLIPVENKEAGASGDSDEGFSESDQVCDILLPEGVQLEYSGTAPAKALGPAERAALARSAAPSAGVAGAAAGDRLTTAQRKLAAKKKKREQCGKKRGMYDKAAQGKKKIAKTAKVKETKEAKALEASTEMYVSKAVSQILPRLAERAPPPGTVWRERTQEAEARSATLAYSVKVYEAHKEFSAELDEIARQKAEWGAGEIDVEAIGAEKGGKGRLSFREKYLEDILKKLEARMLKDADADI